MQTRASTMMKTFTDRFPLVGPAFWLATIQYYIVQLIVAAAWHPPYSWSNNTISDLGNNVCANFTGRLVCSPLHNLMNLSFIILGVTMVIGSTLIYQEFRETSGSFAGFSLMAAAGFGTLLVGSFPENVSLLLHQTGAGLSLLGGNIAVAFLGVALGLSQKLRAYTIASGVVGSLAFILFFTHHYFGLGIGGMERLTSYPQTMWLIVFGIYMSRNHLQGRT